ncbi:MAG: hypothetical protein J5617_03870 [Bacilli bacterium]|nr:hypothetical protein [Bacilli bacterium]
MDDILIKEYIEALLEEAKDQGLFENTDDLASYLMEHGVTVEDDLV